MNEEHLNAKFEEETNQELEDLKEELEEKEQELYNYDDEEAYNEMLDDCHESVFNIYPSTILKECDPIAYRCGLSDFEDEGRSELENEISDLKTSIEELEEVL